MKAEIYAHISVRSKSKFNQMKNYKNEKKYSSHKNLIKIVHAFTYLFTISSKNIFMIRQRNEDLLIQ